LGLASGVSSQAARRNVDFGAATRRSQEGLKCKNWRDY